MIQGPSGIDIQSSVASSVLVRASAALILGLYHTDAVRSCGETLHISSEPRTGEPIPKSA